jgi:hypothetical protein
MPHLDPDRLSLLALYDDWLDEEGREHLRSCSACSADYAALRRPVDAMKTTPDATSLGIPGPHVWAGIHRELGLSQAVQNDPLATPPEQPAVPEQPVAPEQMVAPARLTTRSARRRTAAWWQRPAPWLAAAAAALLVVTVTVWTLNRAPAPIAQAELAPLAQYSATGSAKVLREPDGTRRLEVNLSKDEARGYQEVWLIAPDLSRLVSLGVMNSDSGTFEVPAGLQLADFPIVDVSDEPMDGNPAHSTVSIVRGTLNS